MTSLVGQVARVTFVPPKIPSNYPFIPRLLPLTQFSLVCPANFKRSQVEISRTFGHANPLGVCGPNRVWVLLAITYGNFDMRAECRFWEETGRLKLLSLLILMLVPNKTRISP